MLRLSCEKAVITVPPAEGLHVLPAAFDRSVQKPREPQQRKEEKDMNRIGIIGAMEIEVARLKEMMTDPTLPLYRKRISQKCRIHQHFWKICFKII